MSPAIGLVLVPARELAMQASNILGGTDRLGKANGEQLYIQFPKTKIWQKSHCNKMLVMVESWFSFFSQNIVPEKTSTTVDFPRSSCRLDRLFLHSDHWKIHNESVENLGIRNSSQELEKLDPFTNKKLKRVGEFWKDPRWAAAINRLCSPTWFAGPSFFQMHVISCQQFGIICRRGKTCHCWKVVKCRMPLLSLLLLLLLEMCEFPQCQLTNLYELIRVSPASISHLQAFALSDARAPGKVHGLENDASKRWHQHQSFNC